MEMVVVSMADEHEVDGWKVVDGDTGHARALDDAVPQRPIGVDEHVHGFELNEKPGVADPGNPHGLAIQGVEFWAELIARAAFEDAGDDLIAKEAVVTLWPSFGGLEAGIFGAVGNGSIGHS